MSDPVVLLSTGDVVGPAGGVTDDSMVLFSGTSGKLIKGNNAVVTSAGLALLDDVNAAAQRVTLGLGTAATATLTTSATDTTAGRVLKVGDFGLGSTAVPVINGQDLNTLRVSGLYYITAPVNGPVAQSLYVRVESVLNGAGLERGVQWAAGVASAESPIYVRTQYNGVWGAWKTEWDTGNLVKTASPTDATAGRLTKVGDFGVGGMLDLRGTIFVTGKPQDIYTKGFVKGLADGGPAGLAIPGIVGINYGVLEVNAHWSEPSGADGIMRSFTQGGAGVVYTQTMANATTWGSWVKNGASAAWRLSTTSAIDLNTITEGGWFQGILGATNANLPALGYFYLQVMNYASSPGNCTQVAYEYTSSTTAPRQFIRGCYAGTWTPWREIALTDSPAFTGTPTAPTASAGTNTTQLANTAFVKTAIDNVNVLKSIGIDQTWQNVAASRVLGTTYTNSTGRPIAISFVPAESSNKTHSLTIDGHVIASLNYGTATVKAQLFGIVPPEGTYKVGSTSTIETWMELR